MWPIIKVENLSKQYRIGASQATYATLRESVTNVIFAPFRRIKPLTNGNRRNPQAAIRNPQANFIWALKDVSFDVTAGEVVGVIGRNGAGKSTLLKILSRITEPTAGGVDLGGRVGSLLEVGTGFHAELTGRENTYLSGAILGMKKAEIDRKFDEIVSFAEVEQFIDTPVKHYSSGMYLRLAFAVAAHLEPEILLIDEVLAVGDYAFQQKCIKKAGQVAGDGRTVLIVSHNLAILSEVAKTAIWIDQGRVRETGPLHSVVQAYVVSGCANTGQWQAESPPPDVAAFVSGIRVRQGMNESSGEVMIDQPFEIELAYTIRRGMSFCRVGVLLANSIGIIILSTAEPDDPAITPIGREPGEYRTRVTLPAWLLAPDTYFLTPHIDDAPLHRLFTADQACSFAVVENAQRGVAHYYRPGVIAPKLPWSLSRA